MARAADRLYKAAMAKTRSKTAPSPRFSKKTIDFLTASGKATSNEWLENHSVEHKTYLVEPLRAVAEKLTRALSSSPDARGYRLPRTGFGRLRRPTHKVGRGEPAYRNYVRLQSARPSHSMFDDNPGLYLFVSPEAIFAGGGLYEPSSRQVKKIRAWIDEDPSELDRLFKSKTFKSEFPGGFQTGRMLKTFPRFYPQNHKRIEWLKLQGYYVKRDFTKKEFYSEDFADLVLEAWRQTLRLNTVLYTALASDAEPPAGFEKTKSTREDSDHDTDENSSELWDDRL